MIHTIDPLSEGGSQSKLRKNEQHYEMHVKPHP